MKGEVVTILIVNSLSILNSRETFRPWYQGALRSILKKNSSFPPTTSFKHAKDAYMKNPRAFISSLGAGASDADNRKLSELLKQHPVLSLMRKNTY